MIRRRKRQTKNVKSSLETRVEDWLRSEGIQFESQYPISLCHVDLYFPLTKTVVELSGCFWHGCLQCFPPEGGEHKRQRAKDMKRYKLFWGLGHKVTVIWEHEVENDFETVKRKLLHAAGIKPYVAPTAA